MLYSAKVFAALKRFLSTFIYLPTCIRKILVPSADEPPVFSRRSTRQYMWDVWKRGASFAHPVNRKQTKLSHGPICTSIYLTSGMMPNHGSIADNSKENRHWILWTQPALVACCFSHLLGSVLHRALPPKECRGRFSASVSRNIQLRFCYRESIEFADLSVKRDRP